MRSSAPQNSLVVLTLDTSWFSRHGGITTFNRNLCIALAGAGARVYCAVPDPTVQEQEHASAAGVHLVRRGDTRDDAPFLPDDVLPDVVVGHGRVTGDAAHQLRHCYPDAARFHVIHTAPDEIEWHKSDRSGDAGMRAEERMRHELRLAVNADRVFTVGPRLHGLYSGELSAFEGAPSPVEINPGFDGPGRESRIPPPGLPRRVLVIGRLEDAAIKGIDIAARGLADALERLGAAENEAMLVLRGVPKDEHEALYKQVGLWSRGQFRAVTRSFSVDEEDLRADLLRATLMLMPSRAESLGLVAGEAIVLGTPVLISERSGLALFLRQRLSPDECRRVIVPVRDDEAVDAQKWGEAIMFVLRHPEAAYADADRLRQVLATTQTWRMAAEVMLGQLAGSASADAAPTIARQPAALDSAPVQSQRSDPQDGVTPGGQLRPAPILGVLIAVLAVLGGLVAFKWWPASTYPEIAGNRNGSPLYIDAGGTPVSDARRIPYLTPVRVRCKVPDATGMASVSYWYHIVSSPYEDLFAPSDTFTNGDPSGTGSSPVDPAVPDCKSR
ncbi:glycosyltransferase family 4 protein [Plantactinospora mayteni]|nr:glycosyltransferase family 4 protein [Plantactinospora mayteni]